MHQISAEPLFQGQVEELSAEYMQIQGLSATLAPMSRQQPHRKPHTPREHALCILYKVEHSGAYAHVLLQQAYQELGNAGASHALLTQLVKGTLEQRLRLDSCLRPFLKSPLDNLDGWTRNILRLGAYQILNLNKLPIEVSVNETVELAKTYAKPSKVPFVNAILRNLCRNLPAPGIGIELSTEELSEHLSHPLWILELWIDQLGLEEAKLLCEADNQPWPTWVRANTLRIPPADLEQRCLQDGLRLEKGAYCRESFKLLRSQDSSFALDQLSSFKDGLFTIQDESAALISHLVDPQPGEFIVDLCSAPGSKASHMAALMNNQGELLAVDPHPKRLGLINNLCKRLAVNIVHTAAADGRVVELSRQADRILIDAPCSGLGVLGNKADIRWTQSIDEIPQLIALQKELLDHAASLVKPGGRVVYSTCTINSAENQDVVDAFLSKHPEFHTVSCQGLLSDELVTHQGFYQALPHKHGIAGAFAAVLDCCT